MLYTGNVIRLPYRRCSVILLDCNYCDIGLFMIKAMPAASYDLFFAFYASEERGDNKFYRSACLQSVWSGLVSVHRIKINVDEA